MSSSVYESLFADAVEGCVVEFLDTNGTTHIAYACGRCAVIACRDEGGVTDTAEALCEKLLIDAADRDYQN